MASGSSMKKIWVVQSGQYEERVVNLVAISPQTALAGLKEQHARFLAEYPEHAVQYGPVSWDLREIASDRWEATCRYRNLSRDYDMLSEYEIDLYDFADSAMEPDVTTLVAEALERSALER